MENKIKNIIREVPAENADLQFFFDDDGLTERGGDYCYNLFIVCNNKWDRISGFNIEEYKRVQKKAQAILDDFNEVDDGFITYDGKKYTYKQAMKDNGIEYTSHKCHLLREWAKYADTDKTESIAEYLTIITSHKWETASAYGYCQGDYCEMVYCPEHYKKGVQAYGEVYLGCAKEFCVIDMDENGEETDTVYGYIVADCEARGDDDYKRLVCEWAGIKPEETRLEMIDGYHTYTKYEYRTA